MKEDKKSQRRNLFIALTRNASKKEIKKIEKDEKRQLTRRERKKIIYKNAKKARTTIFISILTMAIGGSGAVAISASSNTRREPITVESTEQSKKSDREKFKERLDAKEYVEPTKMSENIQEATEEINSLETPEDVLNYLKTLYANEYNEDHSTNITEDNIKLFVQYRYGNNKDYSVYNDVATNGDSIMRWKLFSKQENAIDKDFIMAKVLDENNKVIDTDAIVYASNNCETVYSSSEQVDKYEDGTLVDVGNIMRHGLCYYSELDNKIDQNSKRAIRAKRDYKEDFISAVAQYNNNKDKNVNINNKEELEKEK